MNKEKKYKLYDKFKNKVIKLNKQDYEGILTNPYLLNRYSKRRTK